MSLELSRRSGVASFLEAKGGPLPKGRVVLVCAYSFSISICVKGSLKRKYMSLMAPLATTPNGSVSREGSRSILSWLGLFSGYLKTWNIGWWQKAHNRLLGKNSWPSGAVGRCVA